MAKSSAGSEHERVRALQERLGHLFRAPALLALALTHRSHPPPPESGPGAQWHNERLEFLGDAVLDMVISQRLYQRFPAAPEGALSQWRASLVNTRTLSRMARALGVGPCLRLGRGEEKTGGREKSSILADAVEALVGAVYLDGGQEAVESLVERLWGDALAAIDPERVGKDYKSLLQERLQGAGRPLPEYQVVRVSGADHARTFQVSCRVAGEPPQAAEGSTKRAAERAAARLMLEQMEQGRADHG